MRKITVDCELCGERMTLERAKEAFFQTGTNAYHLRDLCPRCLDEQLKRAESINDTSGFRQTAAVLMKLPGHEVPDARAARA
jgi:hypothetical protein